MKLGSRVDQQGGDLGQSRHVEVAIEGDEDEGSMLHLKKMKSFGQIKNVQPCDVG